MVPGHAFLSYVREDRHAVDRLQGALEDAGIRVWRDTADLWPGEDWRACIRQAITGDALAFIACFSTSSLSRAKSYQNEEIVLAMEQIRLRKPQYPWLIPVRLDDCVIPDWDMGGGRTLASIQRADLFGDHADEHTARLVKAVLRILGQRSPDPAPARRPPAVQAASTTEEVGNRAPHAGYRPAGPEPAQAAVIRVLAEAVKAAYADPSNSFRAVTIAQIAAVMAAHDPERAALLLADAERCAKAIPEISKRAAVIADMAAMVVVTDKWRAARLAAEAEHAQSAADSYLKRYLPPRSGRADPIPLGPGGFERLTEASNNERRRPETLARVAEVLAATSPDDAERTARTITVPGGQATALARIAKVVAATDPDRAARLAADAEHAAHTISDQALKIECLAGMTTLIMAADPDRASRLVARALSIAGSLSLSALTQWDLARIALALAGTDTGQALQIGELITDHALRAEVIAGLAETAAADDPERAARIAQTLAIAEWQAYAHAAVAEATADNDLDLATRLATDTERTAQALPDSNLKHATLAHVAHVIAASNPDRAERIALTIADHRWKARALTRVADTITATHRPRPLTLTQRQRPP